jgi:hypothetical protein
MPLAGRHQTESVRQSTVTSRVPKKRCIRTRCSRSARIRSAFIAKSAANALARLDRTALNAEPGSDSVMRAHQFNDVALLYQNQSRCADAEALFRAERRSAEADALSLRTEAIREAAHGPAGEQ